MTKQPKNLGKSGAKEKLTGDWGSPRDLRRHEAASIDDASSNPLNLIPGLSFSVMFRLLLGSKICRSRMAQFCRKNYGLEPNLFLILLAASEGHLQQGILAKSLGIDKNAMVFLIDKLELRRLIRRVPNPDNRRERFVECTHKGAQIAKEIKANYREIARWGFYPLAELQIEQFGILLTQIIESRQDLPCPAMHSKKTKRTTTPVPRKASRHNNGDSHAAHGATDDHYLGL
jgi:DNA-binding MarR family transcriptional regulator